MKAARRALATIDPAGVRGVLFFLPKCSFDIHVSKKMVDDDHAKIDGDLESFDNGDEQIDERGSTYLTAVATCDT